MSGLFELERLLPGAVVSDRDGLAGYRRDAASWAPAGEPVALVRQQNTEQVQELDPDLARAEEKAKAAAKLRCH